MFYAKIYFQKRMSDKVKTAACIKSLWTKSWPALRRSLYWDEVQVFLVVKQVVEQTIALPVIWSPMAFMSRHLYIYIYVCVCVSVNFGWWYSIRCQRQTSLSVLSLNRLTDTGILLCTCRCWFVYVQVCNCMAQQSARHIRIYYGYPLLYLTHSHPWRAIHNTFSKQCAHISILIPLPFIHWFAIIGRIQSNDILTEHFHCGLLGKQTRYIYEDFDARSRYLRQG